MFHYSDPNDAPWSFIDLKSACHCSHIEMLCALCSHGEYFPRHCITLAEKRLWLYYLHSVIKNWWSTKWGGIHNEDAIVKRREQWQIKSMNVIQFQGLPHIFKHYSGIVVACWVRGSDHGGLLFLFSQSIPGLSKLSPSSTVSLKN